MRQFRLALLGFGNVGRAFAHLLLNKEIELRERYGIITSVTGLYTSRHGAAIDEQGLDLTEALKTTNLGELSKKPIPKEALSFIRECEADVLFENSPVNYESGQPAVAHLQAGLEMGMHTITANKGPVVHAYRRLTELAERKGRKFLFESTVMDGAPIFSLFREALPGARLISFKGILNSTTNMMLSLMEEGKSFEEAVRHCQAIGIAETDTSGDIDGWDAAVKVAALATVLMDTPILPKAVRREGIRGLTKEAIAEQLVEGRRWKLMCNARKRADGVETSVHPEIVTSDSPFYRVGGTTSVVQFETDTLGLLTIEESDPGPHSTAYGLLADFLNAVK